GQDGADASVVGDGGAVQRHVEVGADEDPPARDPFGEEFVDRLHMGSLLSSRGARVRSCSLVIERARLLRYVRQGPVDASVRRPSPALISGCLLHAQSWLPTKTVRSTRRLE